MVRNFFVSFYKLGIRLLGGRGLHRIYPFGAIHDFLSDKARSYHTPEFITIFGNVLYLVPGDNMGLSIWGEAYERNISRYLEKRLRPGDTFIDVGANIGFFTLLAAKYVGPTGRVIAFEPDAQNLNILKKNIEINEYKNITVVPMALSDHEGTISFFVSSHNAGDHTIYDRQEKIQELRNVNELDPRGAYDQHTPEDPRKEIVIEATTLDAYLEKEVLVPHIIKIDVQGAEGLVLKGMKQTLSLPEVEIISEFWPAGMKMGGVSANECLRIIKNSGFSFYEMQKLGNLLEKTEQELIKEYTVYNNHTGDILYKKT